MRNLALAAISLLLLALAAACDFKSTDYSSFADVAVDGWRYGDTIKLSPALPDSIASGRLAIAVRHTGAYEYSNVWLEVSTPLADTVRRDTINVHLADVFGNWYGRGIGVSFLTVDTLPGLYTLASGDSVNLRHIMRVDSLTEVEQIGLIFIP